MATGPITNSDGLIIGKNRGLLSPAVLFFVVVTILKPLYHPQWWLTRLCDVWLMSSVAANVHL